MRQPNGLRNRLIHGYDTVDLDVVWRIAMVDVPALMPDLERLTAGPGPP